MQDWNNQRQEPRFGIASAILPFLGHRSNDYQPFQYLVQDISANGVRIAIPSWVVLRDVIYPGDHIHLQVPFAFQGQAHNSGVVVWQRWDESLDAQVCGISLHTQAPSPYPVHIALDSKEIQVDLQNFERIEDLLVRVFKDSVLVKHGLSIYLRHLDSYFFRTSLINRQEYRAFRELIIQDISQRVVSNYNGLMAMYTQVAEAQDIDQAFSQVLNLEELRQLMQPEVYIELFSRVLSLEVVDLYLKAIKTLEQKVYLNYNTVVMLYLRNLIQSLDTQAPVEMPCLTCSA
jgi:hypothetical protein